MTTLIKIGASAAALCLAIAAPASATTYFFHFEGDPANTTYGDVLIDGHFTTAGPGFPAAITGVNGTVSRGNSAVLDGPITSLSPYASSDNILYAIGTGGDYSFGGVSFTVSKTVASVTSTADYNLFDWNGGTYLLVSTVNAIGYPQFGTPAAPPPPPPPPGSPPVQAPALVGIVPEPATWALMMVGLAGMGASLRATRRRVAATA